MSNVYESGAYCSDEHAADAVYRIYLYSAHQLDRCEDDRVRCSDDGPADEPFDLLYEYFDEPDDALHDLCYGHHERGQRRTCGRSAE